MLMVAAAGVVALTDDDDDGADTRDGAGSMGAYTGAGKRGAGTTDLEFADVRPALLAESDVGEGFTLAGEIYEGPPDSSIPDDAGFGGPCRGPHELVELVDGTHPQDTFLQVVLGKTDAVVIQYLALTAAGDPTLAEEIDAWSDCQQFSYSRDSGMQIETRVVAVQEVDHLGKAAYSVELQSSYVMGDGVRHTIDEYKLRVFRAGVVSVTSLAVQDDPGADLAEFTRELAAKADDKLRSALVSLDGQPSADGRLSGGAGPGAPPDPRPSGGSGGCRRDIPECGTW